MATFEWGDMESELFATEVVGITEHNLRACTIGLKAWRHSFEGSAAMANFGRVYPHSAGGVLVLQVPRCLFVLSHEVSSLF